MVSGAACHGCSQLGGIALLKPFLLRCGSMRDGPLRGCGGEDCRVMYFKSKEWLWSQKGPGFPGAVAWVAPGLWLLPQVLFGLQLQGLLLAPVV